jgi:hypothetical protein
MDSFLKDRKSEKRVKMPSVKENVDFDTVAAELSAKKAEKKAKRHLHTEEEPVVETKLMSVPEGVTNAPKVEMVMEDGVVQRICITCDNGQYVELDCVYDDE